MKDSISEMVLIMWIIGASVLGLVLVVAIDVMTNPVYIAERRATREKNAWLCRKNIHRHRKI
jgi:hypothetical protein